MSELKHPGGPDHKTPFASGGATGATGATGRNPAGPNELGRMPVGVLPEGSNVKQLAHEQADAEERAGNGAQDRPLPDAGPIVTDNPSHNDDSGKTT